jgi:hypothetical protein
MTPAVFLDRDGVLVEVLEREGEVRSAVRLYESHIMPGFHYVAICQ